jgi:hypothetical protein
MQARKPGSKMARLGADMNEDPLPFDADMPCTEALRRRLAVRRDHAYVADLLFLERWEMSPSPGTGAALRIAQIRRANPELAAAIRAELAAAPRHVGNG